jgi:hypothetical protein
LDSGHTRREVAQLVSDAGFGSAAEPELLEGSVLRPWFGLVLTGILCALSLPFFAISLLIATIYAAGVAVISPFRSRKRSNDSDFRNAWAANEFGFERAIEAYEELIDAHAWRRE